MYRILILVVLVLMAGNVFSQKKQDPIIKYLPTDNVDIKSEDNRKKNAPKRKVYSQIIKNSTKNILYGNACAIEATHRMGFEYVVQTKKNSGSVGGFKRAWNNFKVKTRLFFLRSPFWRIILKKRFKKCRIQSGDKVG